MPRNRTFPCSRAGHQRLDGPVRLHLRHAGRDVHLDQVKPVGAQPAQALADSGRHVGGAVAVRERRPGAGRRRAEQAAALGRQEVLIPAMAEVPADEFLATAVADRGQRQVLA